MCALSINHASRVVGFAGSSGRNRPAPRRAVRAPRRAPAPECPDHPGYTGCCPAGRGEAADRPKITIILDCVRCGERPGGHAPPWGGTPSLCEVCLPLAVAEGPPPPLPAPPALVFSAAARPRAVAKPRPRLRSADYLAHVRALPCCSCGAAGPSDPHHWSHSRRRGVGTKLDDLLTIPLCRRCHDEYHRRGTLPGRTKAETALCLLDAQVGCLVDYLAGRMAENGAEGR